MLELALQAGTALGTDALPQQAPTLAGHAKDLALPLAAVISAYKIGRPLAVGHVLPDDTSHVDFDTITNDRDPRAVAVMVLAYGAGVLLTATAVYLLASLAWALAWAGTLAFVAAVVALLAARNASPVNDVRAILLARRQAGGDE